MLEAQAREFAETYSTLPRFDQCCMQWMIDALKNPMTDLQRAFKAMHRGKDSLKIHEIVTECAILDEYTPEDDKRNLTDEERTLIQSLREEREKRHRKIIEAMKES